MSNFLIKNIIDSGCKVRCNIHNRRFDPIFDINLNDNKKIYQSNIYNLTLNDNKIIIDLRKDIDKNITHDWSC